MMLSRLNNSKKETKIGHNSNKDNLIIKQRNDKQQLNILSDVIHEARQKYRESENIAIDPEYIIEEEEKRQPLSFQE